MPLPLVALLASPQAMAAAVAIVTVLGAGLSGAFDSADVEVNDDRAEDGIFIPVNPTISDSDLGEDSEYEYVTVYPTPTPNQFNSMLPMGFVSINSSIPTTNEYDPDIPDDVRPPSSSFGIAGEAYDSGAGFLIMLIVAGLLAAYCVTVLGIKKKVRC